MFRKGTVHAATWQVFRSAKLSAGIQFGVDENGMRLFAEKVAKIGTTYAFFCDASHGAMSVEPERRYLLGL